MLALLSSLALPLGALLLSSAPRRTVLRNVLLAALGAGGGALAGGCGGGQTASSAPLFCPRPVLDFGPVWEGTALEASFDFEVRSESPLSIQSAEADCGCTVARLVRVGSAGESPYEWGTPLLPGTRLRLEATYDTRGKRGPSPRRVSLRVPELDRPVVARMLAEVRPWLLAEPDSLRLTRVSEGASGAVRFEVRQAEGRAFGLRWSATSVPEGIDVALKPLEGVEEGRATMWAATVSLGPELPRGMRTYPILLETDVVNPQAPPGVDGRPRWHGLSLELPVEIRGALSLSPPNLNFGLVRPGELVSRTLRLECHDPDFEFLPPRAELEPVQDAKPFPLGRTAGVTVRPVPGMAAFDLEVTLDGLDASLAGTVLARLVVETGHPGLPRLEAPLLAVVAAPATGEADR